MWFVLHFLWRTLLVLDLILFTLAFWLLSFFHYSKLTPFFRRIFQAWCQCFIRALGVKLIIHQHYHTTLPKQIIAIANHPSIFEDVGMPAIFNVTFLSKQELLNWPVLGRIAKAVGILFVKREDKSSRKVAREALAAAIASGESIGIFPEGGCFSRRVHFPFTSGAFDLAFATKVPIVPVFLYYPQQENFEWLTQSGPKKVIEIMKTRNAVAHYHIFEPINPTLFPNAVALRHYVEQQYRIWENRYLN